MSFGTLKLGELGEVSFVMLKFSELGELMVKTGKVIRVFDF